MLQDLIDKSTSKSPHNCCHNLRASWIFFRAGSRREQPVFLVLRGKDSERNLQKLFAGRRSSTIPIGRV